ncbi:MAG: Zn-dependent hydrolase [Deltaproteobacteria bacterium]|nr:MAG: Zn-dependent hydrolase [Deltaproteobacteria bacterium]
MKINSERLWQTHMTAAEMTEADSPYTRRSFTHEYREMRGWLADAFQQAGLEVNTDAAGNLLALYEGSLSGGKSVGVGSHTDTVPCGGRFDGVSGVLAFLEVVRSMKEHGYRPKKNIVGIDFLAEEPSEFRLSCIGSRLATGNFNEEMLQLTHRDTGQRLGDAVCEWGGDLSRLAPGSALFETSNFDGFLELHIEQGPILEKKQLDVGLVTGICSVTRFDFVITGKADHAGNTPMDMRSDAVAAATKLIGEIYDIGGEMLARKPYFTATVGRIDVLPNGSNVIAEKVYFTLDIRSESNDLVTECLERIFTRERQIAQQTATSIDHVKISQSRPSISDPFLLSVLEDQAKKLGLQYTRMLSGAGHDAAYMSTIMPMAMIFVPCRKGISHAAAEYSSKEQLAKGTNLLLHALVALTA